MGMPGDVAQRGPLARKANSLEWRGDLQKVELNNREEVRMRHLGVKVGILTYMSRRRGGVVPIPVVWRIITPGPLLCLH